MSWVNKKTNIINKKTNILKIHKQHEWIKKQRVSQHITNRGWPLLAFLRSDKYDAIGSQGQGGVVVAGFDGQRVGAVVAQVIHGDLVADRTDDSVPIVWEYYVPEPVHGAQQVGELKEYLIRYFFKVSDCHVEVGKKWVL